MPRASKDAREWGDCTSLWLKEAGRLVAYAASTSHPQQGAPRDGTPQSGAQGQAQRGQQQGGGQGRQPGDPPFVGNYPLTVLFVILALCPDLFLSTAMPLLRHVIAPQLHTTVSVLGLASTFSNAGWAFGAVLAADLALRFPNWKLNLVYESAFIIGSLVGLFGPAAGFFIAGRILQGTATGMLLVSALPPLIRNFPPSKLGSTVAFTDIGLFGAVAAGPTIGGYVAASGTWRLFFAAVALLGVLALTLILLVVSHKPGYDPSFPFDWKAIALAAGAAGLTFYGVGNLTSQSWTSPLVWVPTVLGLLCVAVLIVYQYKAKNPLMPVKPLSSTYPIIGIIAGVLAGAAYTGLLEVLLTFLPVRGYSPLGLALVLWTGIAGAVLGAYLFGQLFTTRAVLLLPLMGIAGLMLGAFLLSRLGVTGGTGLILWSAGLLGVGASLTVAPGLFIAGLSVSPKLVGRAFALVEMLRLAGAFAIVPAFVYFAEVYGRHPFSLMLGAHMIDWIILIGLALVVLVTTALFFLGGARIHPPDIVAYIERNEPALESPDVGEAAFEGRVGEAVTEGLKSAIGLDDDSRQEHAEEEDDAQARNEPPRDEGGQPSPPLTTSGRR